MSEVMNVWGDECLRWWMSEVMNVRGDECLILQLWVMNVWGDECRGDECLILGRGWWKSKVMNVWIQSGGDECLRWWMSGWWMSDNQKSQHLDNFNYRSFQRGKFSILRLQHCAFSVKASKTQYSKNIIICFCIFFGGTSLTYFEYWSLLRTTPCLPTLIFPKSSSSSLDFGHSWSSSLILLSYKGSW